MHARELVDLAGILSSQGPVLIRGGHQLSPSGIQQYWTASKCRLDRWARSLKCFTSDAAQLEAAALRVQWPYIRGVLEEILTGEVLTRVWSAILALSDRQHAGQDAASIGRSIMMGHLEARHRVLMLLVRGPGIDSEGAVKLNHLRRRTERWADLLVGHLAPYGDISDFAIDNERAQEFSKDLAFQSKETGSRQAWPLMLASLHAAFKQGLAPASPNEDLNASIASSILACVPSELFDSTGLFRSLWLTRLTNVTSDVQGLVDSLLGADSAGDTVRHSAGHSAKRSRFRS